MVASLRADTADLVRLAGRDLDRLWRLVAAGASADEALRDLLPAIVREYGSAGASLAAEWYDAQRTQAQVPGTFEALPIEADDRGSQALIGWALDTATDDSSLQLLILGGVQRRIADHLRETVMQSAIADPKARGWQRVGVGACKSGFCDMLIGRGAVYTEATADFAAHDHCQCSAVPAWGGLPVPVKPYTPSLRNISKADRVRVETWIREHNVPRSPVRVSGSPPEELISAAKAANPKFGTGPGHENNCGPCTLAYEMQRRAENRVAGADLSGFTTRDYLDRFWRDPATGRPPRGPKMLNSREAFERYMEDMPVGMRGVLDITWRTGGGHFASVEKTASGWHLMEPQDGDWYSPEIFFDEVDLRRFGLIRTDHLDLTPAAYRFTEAAS